MRSCGLIRSERPNTDRTTASAVFADAAYMQGRTTCTIFAVGYHVQITTYAHVCYDLQSRSGLSKLLRPLGFTGCGAAFAGPIDKLGVTGSSPVSPTLHDLRWVRLSIVPMRRVRR